MKKLSPTSQTAWIRLAYLLPLIGGIAMLVLACIPRFFYLLEGDPQSDVSLFWLLGNTYSNCTAFFQSTEDRLPSEFYFSITSFVFCLLSWLCIILYSIFACFTALLMAFTWRGETSSAVNAIKRCYRILVPNRGFYPVFCLMPILPACFPYLLQGFYGSFMKLDTPVFYYGVPDVVPVAILAAGAIALFFATRSAQKKLRMDLFRLYKTEK